MNPRSLPERILAVDVGAGTQDILLYEAGKPVEASVKLILPAQTEIVARRIRRATLAGKDVFLVGNLMGGGPNVSAIKRHLSAGHRVYATPLAGKTIRDNLRQVKEMGVEIVGEAPPGALPIETRDVDLEALAQALAPFETELPTYYAVAVQDHGECLEGSNRRFRFRLWEGFLAGGGALLSLAHWEIPPALTRMQAVGNDLLGAMLMDTGAAAVWGALEDEEVAAHRQKGLVAVNVGNQHTLGVLLRGERIWGLFEHHTVRMTREKLADHIARLRMGALSNEEVFSDNGHGVAIHPDYTRGRRFEFVAITGPQRAMAKGLGYMAAPYGDMMLTGCFGLVAAFRRTWK